MGESILFPYDKIRLEQKDFVEDLKGAIGSKRNLIAHAPTGLGKTAAVLSVALKKAIENDLSIMFLTSRHTQHKIVIDTLKEIKEKFDIDFGVSDLIAKRFMCGHPGVEVLRSGDFIEYCKSLKKDDACDFYSNIRAGSALTFEAKKALEEIKQISPADNKTIVDKSISCGVCPYEIGILLARNAKVIISDYQYVFNDNIRDNFLLKIGRELKDIILIIDEGHNLPGRVRDNHTSKLSNIAIARAIKEAKKFGYDGIVAFLNDLQHILLEYSKDVEQTREKKVKKDDFYDRVCDLVKYNSTIEELEAIAESIKLNQRQSSIGSIANFLKSWKGTDVGFVRIFSMQETGRDPILTLSYRCLDPSIATSDIVNSTYSTIIMSGTLTPTLMYKDMLGFDEDTIEKSYQSPFDDENKLNLIVPTTTTKFSMRTPEQFMRIGEITSEIANLVPGNTAIFFPSYHIRDEVYKTFNPRCKKTIFLEKPQLTKDEKNEMLEKFKSYSQTGAVLLGAISGSFGEGIDLPGDLLKCVVVVGLPLSAPDLETKELINYFDSKFQKGWDYGYIFPAFNKTMQSAGRCIRSETDKGVVIFLDERYSWPNYIRCFPTDSPIKISKEYAQALEWFFDN